MGDSFQIWAVSRNGGGEGGAIDRVGEKDQRRLGGVFGVILRVGVKEGMCCERNAGKSFRE